MMKCAICKQAIDTEHPETLHGVNPYTFLHAWMHSFCFMVAYEEIEQQEAGSVDFLNRQDEYLEKITI